MAKRLLTNFIILFAFAITIGAQTNEKRVFISGGVTYATDSKSDEVGFYVKALYRISSNWDAAATYSFVQRNTTTNWNIFDIDAHYNLLATDVVHFYWLAGVNVTHWETKEKLPFGRYPSHFRHLCRCKYREWPAHPH